ncbi:hypothetical protein PM082_002367 [Marasmius tenuissimus]|nr:hypothetical protein PM082_002367 [Marasmius tenuissimus]
MKIKLKRTCLPDDPKDPKTHLVDSNTAVEVSLSEIRITSSGKLFEDTETSKWPPSDSFERLTANVSPASVSTFSVTPNSPSPTHSAELPFEWMTWTFNLPERPVRSTERLRLALP